MPCNEPLRTLNTPEATSPNFSNCLVDRPIDLVNSSQLEIMDPRTTTSAPNPVPISAFLKVERDLELMPIIVDSFLNDLIAWSIESRPCVIAIMDCISLIAFVTFSDSTPISSIAPFAA